MRIQRRRFVSFDGTRLSAYAAGDRDAPPLVLCGGLGGGVGIWRPVFERLATEYRIVTWDYRGLYASEPAAEPADYSLPVHARDLMELLRNEGIESPFLAGWSMGVQVALEAHRERPDLARGLVLLHGTAGRPMETAFDTSLSAWVAPWVLGALGMVGRSLSWVGPSLTRMPPVVSGFVRTSQRLGMMAEDIDLPGFRDMAEEWTRLHLGIYARIFGELAEHDASDLLDAIAAPTLVIAGDRDRFTPPGAAQRLAEALPNAAYELVSGATHFGLLERPEEILHRITRFLGEHAPHLPGESSGVSSGA